MQTLLLEDEWYKVDIEWEKGLGTRKRLWLNDSLEIDFISDSIDVDINRFLAYLQQEKDQTLDDVLICVT